MWGLRLESESLPSFSSSHALFFLPLRPPSLPLGTFRQGYWVHAKNTAGGSWPSDGLTQSPLKLVFKWVGRVHGKAPILKDGTDSRPPHSLGPQWHFLV